MAARTIAFCRNCKWRSSAQPVDLHCAGAPCPTCGCGISALHFDPAYTGTDDLGRPYNEMAVAAAHLFEAGVPTAAPGSPTPIPPRHPSVAPPVVPTTVG
jgi:hypothetical protein